ncbi:MAG: hypothetical protein WAN46_12710 [Gammaproteobacteria bacterium]|jgi:hypothetical protein
MTIALKTNDAAFLQDARVQSFAERLVHSLNEAGGLLMTSIGHHRFERAVCPRVPGRSGQRPYSGNGSARQHLPFTGRACRL